MNLLLLVGIGVFLIAVGALVGRYYTPDRRPLRRAAEEGRRYVRGLVDVLDGNTSAAIDEIGRALQQNTKTVEAYFALGSLFRQRSEHERAVRVHQTILMRRDIDKPTRLRAHHQLALDFIAAGFPRRATKALEWVVAQDKKRIEAWGELARLYEVNGDWERAAAAQRRLGRLGGKDTSRLQAHLLAEQAQRKLEAGDLTAARRALSRALAVAGDSVHVLYLLGLYQERRENQEAAAKAWEKALRRAPELVGFLLPLLERVRFELDGDLSRVERLLDELRAAHPASVHLKLAAARHEARRNPERALAMLGDLLGERPTLMPARREAARLVLERGDAAKIRQALEELLLVLDRAERGYRCAACGHTAAALFWRCPSCRVWESVRVAWGRRAGESAA